VGDTSILAPTSLPVQNRTQAAENEGPTCACCGRYSLHGYVVGRGYTGYLNSWKTMWWPGLCPETCSGSVCSLWITAPPVLVISGSCAYCVGKWPCCLCV